MGPRAAGRERPVLGREAWAWQTTGSYSPSNSSGTAASNNMSLDLTFRMRVAQQLLDGESLPAVTKERAETAGFRAFEPIEELLNSLDESFRDRPKAREEEALETLGIFAAPPVSPIVESLYQSPFLDDLRAEKAKAGAAYRRLSINDEDFRSSGSNGLSLAFARGQQILKREAAQAAPERVGLKQRPGLSWFRAVLARNLAPREFERATALEKSAQLVYRKELQHVVLTFVFDTRRLLQHRFLISTKTTDGFDIFSRTDAVEIGLQRTSFAMMANGRPYLTPNDQAECDWSVKLLCLAVDLVAERLTS